MRHGVKTKKLGRNSAHRKAMLKNLATSILLKGLSENQMDRHVRTTVPKAKAVRSLVDRLITYAKKGDLAAKRQAARFVKDKQSFQGLFQILADRYRDRNGGYTRVLKLLDYRHGDNAKMAIVTLVDDAISKSKKNEGSKSLKIAKTRPSSKEEVVNEPKEEDASVESIVKEESKKAE